MYYMYGTHVWWLCVRRCCQKITCPCDVGVLLAVPTQQLEASSHATTTHNERQRRRHFGRIIDDDSVGTQQFTRAGFAVATLARQLQMCTIKGCTIRNCRIGVAAAFAWKLISSRIIQTKWTCSRAAANRDISPRWCWRDMRRCRLHKYVVKSWKCDDIFAVIEFRNVSECVGYDTARRLFIQIFFACPSSSSHSTMCCACRTKYKYHRHTNTLSRAVSHMHDQEIQVKHVSYVYVHYVFYHSEQIVVNIHEQEIFCIY